MQILRIKIYQVDVPTKPGGYTMSGQRIVEALDATVVVIETSGGMTGVGESCPWGPNYLPAFAGAIRAGLREIAPHLIGADPRCLAEISACMDGVIVANHHIKHALDVACWDILAKHANMPLHDLLGGKLTEMARCRVGLSAASPQEMCQMIDERQASGYHHFSVKVGDDPDLDIERLSALSGALQSGQTMVADANGAWLAHEALRVTQALKDASNLYIEQPCATYEECLLVRRGTSLPMILDECVVDIADLLRVHQDKAADAINIKVPRIGGVTRAKQFRDLCVSMGLPVYIMDTGNTALGAALTAHLALSTPEQFLLGVWNYKDWSALEIADGGVYVEDGKMQIDGAAPGLGVTLRYDVLGEPIGVYE